MVLNFHNSGILKRVVCVFAAVSITACATLVDGKAVDETQTSNEAPEPSVGVTLVNIGQDNSLWAAVQLPEKIIAAGVNGALAQAQNVKGAWHIENIPENVMLLTAAQWNENAVIAGAETTENGTVGRVWLGEPENGIQPIGDALPNFIFEIKPVSKDKMLIGGANGFVGLVDLSSRTIEQLPTNMPLDIWAILALSENEWLVGGGTGFDGKLNDGSVANAVISKTTDRGQTWENVWNGNVRINDLVKLDNDKLLAVADAGMVFSGSIDGKDWSEIDVPFSSRINTTIFFDASCGVLAGVDGKIIATRDGGMNWFELSTGVDDFIEDTILVNSISPQRSAFFMVGGNGYAGYVEIQDICTR